MFVFPFGIWNFSFGSYWIILLWVLFDILGIVTGAGGVAYWAHLGGFGLGVGVACLLLAEGRIKMKPYETSLLQLLRDRGSRASDAFPNDAQMGIRGVEDQCAAGKDAAAGDPLTGPASKHFISFQCECGKEITALKTPMGRKRRCPTCFKQFTIPKE